MSAIVTPNLDIEHWNKNMETGLLTMFRCMQKPIDLGTWKDKNASIQILVEWWAIAPSYDPDTEPEGLIFRSDLTPLSKEVLGLAAAHRVRPTLFATDIPNTKDMDAWAAGTSGKTMRRALELENTGAWWTRCLFERSEEQYHDRTEILVCHLMAAHPFVQTATGLNMPLREVLATLSEKPTFFPVLPDMLPDLC